MSSYGAGLIIERVLQDKVLLDYSEVGKLTSSKATHILSKLLISIIVMAISQVEMLSRYTGVHIQQMPQADRKLVLETLLYYHVFEHYPRLFYLPKVALPEMYQ